MSQYITDVDVSLNTDEEKHLYEQGYILNPVNLSNRASSYPVYIWYKTGSSSPVTRVQLSFNDDMSRGLEEAGYQKIDKDLNCETGGDHIYLWFYRGSTEYHVPIVDFFICTEPQEEAQLFRLGYEKLACNLNRKSSGSRIYLWVKREKPAYICDITAIKGFDQSVQLFTQDYIRIDETTNRGAGGPFISIWYRHTTNKKGAITDLEVSNTNESHRAGYEVVNQDLNEGTGGNQVFLWYKRDGSSCPIKAATLITGKLYLLPYQRAGVPVIEKSLNQGNDGADEYLCFYQ